MKKVLHCDFGKSSTQLELIQSQPQPCKQHKNNKIYFLCNTCSQTTPLLCSECIYAHKNHDWILIQNYFTQDVIQLFRTGVSPKGQKVFDTAEQIVKLLEQFKERVKERIQKIQQKLSDDIQILKQKFPVEGGYEIESNKLDNKTMSTIMRIVKAERTFYQTKKLQKVFKQIFKTSQQNINENFDKLEEILNDRKWQTFQKRDLEFIQDAYVSAFQKPISNHDFLFSSYDKSKSIELLRERTLAVYSQQYPKNPAILADRSLSSSNNFFAMKVLKIPTTLKLFKNSTIYLGICVYEKAEYFNYHNILKPSHGSYLISSSGKSYHTKLPEFNNKNINFSFGVDDIISIIVDFQKRSVLFEKQTGILFTRFQMSLELDLKYMNNLRPCLMFQGDLGAEVQILAEEQLQLKLKAQKGKCGRILRKK